MFYPESSFYTDTRSTILAYHGPYWLRKRNSAARTGMTRRHLCALYFILLLTEQQQPAIQVVVRSAFRGLWTGAL